MNLFRKAPIQQKLVLLIMVITTCTLLLACAGFTTYEIITFRASMVVNLSTLAEITGNNAAGALDFNDQKAAQETLSALAAEPHIAGACIYDVNGRLFAKYNSQFASPPKAPAPGHAFRDGNLTLSRTITSKGDTIGAIYLVSDLNALYARLGRYVVILGAAFALTLIIALEMSRRLQWVISEPILELARAARAVGERRDYSIRVTKQNPDEVGALVDGFNQMVAQIQDRDATLEQRVMERTMELEKLHKELMGASRKAGMAEVATSVLHNVGNVLNSINVSTTLVQDTLTNSKTKNLARLAGLVGEHRDHLPEFFASDPKAAQVPVYLDFLAGELSRESQLMITELQLTRKNIDHVKDIVSMQQSYAKYSGVVEKVNPVDLVEDAVRMNDAALRRHEVGLVRDFAPTIKNITAEKQKILQILINLIRNAKYACAESNRADKLVTLVLRSEKDRVRFQVVDNGVGIPPENMERIFNHGFTTRETGHGFGLHSGALAAHEMGGTLTAHSDGPGTGACFTLELPIEPISEHEHN